jgi:hypothetical protein
LSPEPAKESVRESLASSQAKEPVCFCWRAILSKSNELLLKFVMLAGTLMRSLPT